MKLFVLGALLLLSACASGAGGSGGNNPMGGGGSGGGDRVSEAASFTPDQGKNTETPPAVGDNTGTVTTDPETAAPIQEVDVSGVLQAETPRQAEPDAPATTLGNEHPVQRGDQDGFQVDDRTPTETPPPAGG